MSATAKSSAAHPLQTRALKPGFGVEILDLDIARAQEADLLGFDEACRAHPVVLVRNQPLGPEQLIQLARRLGRISPQHRTGPHPDHPGISILSNKKVNGKLVGVHGAGRGWHTDGTTYAKLGLTTLLYGVECPPEGADTLIADTAAAFAALPPARQRELEQIQVIHSRAALMRRYSRYNVSEAELAAMPDIIHPAVLPSPIDGRKALFITVGSLKGVVGMPEEEGTKLVLDLLAHASQERFVYPHKWRAGDVLIWNDLCTLHTATHYDDENYIRLMHRIWVRPFDAVDTTVADQENVGDQ